MKYDPRRVCEILLDELGRALRLSPEAVDRCRCLLAEWLRPRPPVLFLATGDRPPSDDAVESFRVLAALGIDGALLRSHSFARVWPAPVLRARLGACSLLDESAVRRTEIARLPECFRLLCVLTLSDNTVAKTALGLRDALAPQVLRAFLEQGRPVVAAGLPPQRVAMDQNAAIFWGLPLAVRQWLFEGYRTLEQWGVEFVEPARLADAVRRRVFGDPARRASATPHAPQTAAPQKDTPAARRFVTRDDVHAAVLRGDRQLRVSPGTTVTDEARDFARRWGLLLLE